MESNGRFDLSDINARLSVLENELKNHSERASTNQNAIMQMLVELKQGLGIRVEKHGEDIAVLQSQGVEKLERIKDLEKSRTWIVTSIIGTVIAGVVAWISGHKQ